MKNLLHSAPRAFALVLLGLIPSAARGQALPTAEAGPSSVGFQLPTTSGTLSYSLSGSETVNHGYYSSGTTASSNVSGNLAFLTTSKTQPTSLIFSGGFFGGTKQQSTHYLDLAMSQVLNSRVWNLVVSDSVNYLPQTATTGISGVAGTGDLGVDPVTGSSQGVLTYSATRVNNTASGSLQRKLTGSTSLTGNGSYNILRFTGDNSTGVDTDQISGGGGVSHRINALSSISGNFNYSNYTFGGSQFNFESQSGAIQYSRTLSRKLSFGVSAGPQRTSGSNTGLSGPSINVSASANAAYTGEATSGTVGYSRGSNNGSGVSLGALSNSVNGSLHRRFGRPWNASVTGAYTRSTSLAGALAGSFSTNTLVGGAQLSRAISRSFSTYASYTVERQSNSQSSAIVNVFTGISQIFGFGLTYSHSPIRVGRP